MKDPTAAIVRRAEQMRDSAIVGGYDASDSLDLSMAYAMPHTALQFIVGDAPRYTAYGFRNEAAKQIYTFGCSN